MNNPYPAPPPGSEADPANPYPQQGGYAPHPGYSPYGHPHAGYGSYPHPHPGYGPYNHAPHGHPYAPHPHHGYGYGYPPSGFNPATGGPQEGMEPENILKQLTQSPMQFFSNLIEYDNGEFWKGALIGAAAIMLLKGSLNGEEGEELDLEEALATAMAQQSPTSDNSID